MYKQTDQKQELFNAIQDFHHEFINENLMIQHKMLGDNHQYDLNNLFELYSKSFDFTGMESVIATWQNISHFFRFKIFVSFSIILVPNHRHF